MPNHTVTKQKATNEIAARDKMQDKLLEPARKNPGNWNKQEEILLKHLSKSNGKDYINSFVFPLSELLDMVESQTRAGRKPHELLVVLGAHDVDGKGERSNFKAGMPTVVLIPGNLNGNKFNATGTDDAFGEQWPNGHAYENLNKFNEDDADFFFEVIE